MAKKRTRQAPKTAPKSDEQSELDGFEDPARVYNAKVDKRANMYADAVWNKKYWENKAKEHKPLVLLKMQEAGLTEYVTKNGHTITRTSGDDTLACKLAKGEDGKMEEPPTATVEEID